MASEGGGIYNSGSGMLTIANSTFSGNAASETGGGVFNIGALQLANSTVSDNSAAFLAGGVLNFNNLEIGNTILNRGASGVSICSNGDGLVTSLGYNISSDDGSGILTGPGDQINTDPLLGPLQHNGGPTFTHALLHGSPAIDAGDPNFTPPPLHDQRGPDTNSNSHADTYANGYGNCDAFSYCNCYCYAESNSDSFSKTNPLPPGYACAEVSAYSCAAPSLEIQVATDDQ